VRLFVFPDARNAETFRDWLVQDVICSFDVFRIYAEVDSRHGRKLYIGDETINLLIVQQAGGLLPFLQTSPHPTRIIIRSVLPRK
jgi:hypothetical protein